MFVTITVVFRERTANLLVFIITFISTAILTNSLNRRKESNTLVEAYKHNFLHSKLSLCEIILVNTV